MRMQVGSLLNSSLSLSLWCLKRWCDGSVVMEFEEVVVVTEGLAMWLKEGFA